MRGTEAYDDQIAKLWAKENLERAQALRDLELGLLGRFWRRVANFFTRKNMREIIWY